MGPTINSSMDLFRFGLLGSFYLLLLLLLILLGLLCFEVLFKVAHKGKLDQGSKHVNETYSEINIQRFHFAYLKRYRVGRFFCLRFMNGLNSTFGRRLLTVPIRVIMVRTVVIDREALAGMHWKK